MINKSGVALLLAALLLPISVALPATTNNDRDSNSDNDKEQNANEFVRKVLTNEVSAEAQDHSHWMCRVETNTSHGKEVDDVAETRFGDLKRRILLNGHPLTAEQKREDEERIRKFVDDPSALQSSMKKENEDEDQSQKMLKMLPDALIYRFVKRRGDVVELHFTSNPNFHPPSREAEVFQALEGNMWVNRRQLRLIELTGHLNREVKFGDGLLGHLNQGGEFHVKQAEVAPGYWELTLLNVNMVGKALFFKTISVQQHMSRTAFHKISDDLTVAQAADLLQKRAAVAQSARPKSGQ